MQKGGDVPMNALITEKTNQQSCVLKQSENNIIKNM